MKRSLSSLLCELDEKQVAGNRSVKVSGITSDSRRVTPGMMFVSVSGNCEDRDQYVGEAIERGASAIVGQGDLWVGNRSFVQVPDPHLALSRLAAAWFGDRSRNLEIIGITGTNGKTSLSFMLRHIICAHNDACGLIGSIRYEIGERHIPAWKTRPDAVDLQRFLHGMQRAGCEKVVMEIDDHELEKHQVADVEFHWAAFTNLTQDHSDHHQNVGSHFATKRRLFERIAESGKGMIINSDDKYGRRLASEFRSNSIPILTYGLNDHSSDLIATQICQGKTSTSFRISSSENSQCLPLQCSIEMQLPMLGIHNVQNAIAAVGLAMGLGYPIESIVDALENLPPIPGRLEGINQGQPFSVYVDYAQTADALQRVLKTLRRSTSGRLLLLFGCEGGRNEGKRKAMGEVASRFADRLWITNDNPRQEDPERIVKQILSGVATSKCRSDWKVEYDRRQAIAKILHEARAGDCVLIAGKGHETYQEIDGAVIPFEDRLYAEMALENSGYGLSTMRWAS